MGQNKLRGKDLSAIQYTSNKAKSLAIDLMARHYKHRSKQEQLLLLQAVKEDPAAYAADDVLGPLAAEFMAAPELKPKEEVALLRNNGQLQVFGRKGIASNALQQMELAMRLPIAVKGALMPDAHQGYGLPIGGVLATKGAVIPYGVGVDIGCRMSLSISYSYRRFIEVLFTTAGPLTAASCDTSSKLLSFVAPILQLKASILSY